MTRTERLEYLIRLFQQYPDGFTVQELATHFDVTPRTVHGYLQTLQSEPYYLNLISENRKWRLTEGHHYELPPLYVTRDEAIALFLAGRLLARHSDEHNPHIVQSLKKLGGILPGHLGQLVYRSAEALTYRHERPRLTNVLHTVTLGWFLQRQVHIRYYNSKRDISETTLNPYMLEPSSYGLSTYIIGYSSLHGQERTFKVERILEATVLRETFFIPATFDPVARLQTAWNVMYGEKLQQVVLKFRPAIAQRVKESIWHPSQTLVELPDGGVRVTFAIHDPLEMKPWIRAWGPEVEVEQPYQLRKEIARELMEAGEQYYK